MRTSVFTDDQLLDIFKKSKMGDTFHVCNNDRRELKSEQNRVYKAASFAGRQLVMRALKKGGWKAKILE